MNISCGSIFSITGICAQLYIILLANIPSKPFGIREVIYVESNSRLIVVCTKSQLNSKPVFVTIKPKKSTLTPI